MLSTSSLSLLVSAWVPSDQNHAKLALDVPRAKLLRRHVQGEAVGAF